jgi:lipopolysaccharide/colanic/teichoic acid biosynthesis glycosyltransferase
VPDTTRIEDTLVRGYRQLALETPERPRDIVLRVLDILLSSLFLLLSLPISLAIALLVLVTSGTPILYRGERVGRGARVFTMYKFRTLRRGAERRLGQYLGEELVEHTQAEFTPIGKWLKATQLDEIPQFVNVLRGDMSLVGPRPEMAGNVTEFSARIPFYDLRHEVRPGLTGWAQVKAGYSMSVEEVTQKVCYDLYYIKHMSLRFDLRILFDTVKFVLCGRRPG